MNRRRLFSLTIGGLLVAITMFLGLVGLVGAQSGGGTSAASDTSTGSVQALRSSDPGSALSTGYDLSWSTVDGGGQTWSTGGGYTLGGAIGQPDAGAKHSGGDYTLRGGFWHSVCRPAAMDVTITCVGDQVTLSWTHDTANKAYAIHRAASPYQPPDPSSPLATVLAPPWDDEPNTCGDPASNYYYVVRSVCTGAHADGDERAEFDFGLVPGSSY